MDALVLIVFIIVYVGMMLGHLPGLALDRTGVALLGAILLVAAGRMTTAEFGAAMDESTLLLLFALMVVSAQFRMSGFYSHMVRRLAAFRVAPETLLAILIAVTAVLSALLANDIVCLAMTPVLIEACLRRRLDPKPYLLALACAANIGSAATLIGNPQNMLIGQVLHLSFSGYIAEAALPSVLGLAILWLVIVHLWRGKWKQPGRTIRVPTPAHNLHQTIKGFVLLGVLVAGFLFVPWPREMMALCIAGVLLCSRRMRSREMLGLVDWPLLVLFMALFVVNYTMKEWGCMAEIMRWLRLHGCDPETPAALFGLSVVLSNLVSNVPAVMLLLPSATHPLAGPILAVSSTLAGNLIVVGSIANIIVIDQAARLNVRISWRDHARVGIPVTVGSLIVAAVWFWARMP